MVAKKKQSLQEKILFNGFILLLLIGVLWMPIIFFYAEIVGFIHLNDSENWETTTAKVARASVGEKRVNNTSGRQSSFTKVKFLYRYKVKGKLYSSDRYAFGFKNYDKNAITNYKVGDSIQVYYQPENPSIVIVKKKYEYSFWTPVFYILFTALVIFAGFLLKGVFLGR